jgi:phosphoribosylformylglycinamidine synthase
MSQVVVVRFPGSNCDTDCVRAIHGISGTPPQLLWHEDPLPAETQLVILPGGFSYGDYLRCGAIARFAPIMGEVQRFAERGGAVLGICNGFQVLTEAGLLPGALLPNDCLTFVCRTVKLRVEDTISPYTRDYQTGQIINLPVAHGDGRYYCDAATLPQVNVVFRYVDDNPNGALDNIAGIRNEQGNVLGMMPHPERACDILLGSDDGAPLFRSILGARKAALA